MSAAAVTATTVLGMNWYVLLFVILAVIALVAVGLVLAGGGKLAARGRRGE
ncbi:MAG: hypothetical protein H0V81_00165 [Solirubrobacterales bacterium]|nr:hypothetical protein [Solirubrobacterales bacterium]